jgi:hypothetical protein
VSTARTLFLARRLISNENDWCQGAEARNMDGFECGPLDDLACQWDLLGALTYHGDAENTAYDMVRLALDSRRGSPTCVGQFNDDHFHFEVLEVLDEAYRLARDFEQTTGRVSSPEDTIPPAGGLLEAA